MRHSYSSYSLYEKCPAAWKYRYVEGIPDTLPKPAAERGTRLHMAAERYLSGEISAGQLPVQFRAFSNLMEKMVEEGASPEAVWVVNDRWSLCTDGTSEAWVKSIIDVHWINGDTLHIRDFKSGRVYVSHREQLELYMVMGAAIFPGVERVVAEAIYLDQATFGSQIEHNRLWLTELQKLWKERFDEIEKDTTHEAKPSIFACRWCPYGVINGGPCDKQFAPQAAPLDAAVGKESGG